MTICRLVIVLAATAACDGRVLHLGDGPVVPDGGCQHFQVKANEVVWIGDSWVTDPGTQHDRVRDLARVVGAIGTNDDYVVRAAPATTMAMIASQYDAQQAGATKVKVLIMDGGGWDTIKTGGNDASVANAASGFKQLLAKVASDGTVQHVIYYLYPELATIPGVSALRSVMQQACTESKVPCHFLDLQPLWRPEYTDRNNNIQASEMGARVIGDNIWTIMQLNCIAQ